MASDTKTPTPTIQPDALAYAKKRGVDEYLPAVLEMAQRVYPGARQIAVIVEDDPSIPDFRYLVIEVHVVGWTSEQYFEGYNHCQHELGSLFPSQVAMEFCHDLRIDEE
jgi:hypothetical protein